MARRERGSVQELERGRKYRVYLSVGRDQITGTRRVLTKTVFGTKREADDELARLIVAAAKGDTGTAPETVGALIDRWLEHAEPNLAPWTMRGYRNKVESYIRPALGDLPLRKLTTARLDNFYRDLQQRGSRRNQGEPLSAQTVRHVHSIVRRACRQGCRWGWLDRNPADLAEPPSVPVREHDAPTPAELVRVLDELDVDMRELAVVAIVTGARRGELAGLRWTDLDDGQLTIARSIADPPEGIVVKSPKTGKGRRLALDAHTVQMLSARRLREAEKALACGVPYPSDAYVFADAPGGTNPLRPALITKRWANAAARAGVKVRLHDTRHFAVSELLEAGFEVGGVAKRVGHASTKMTTDRYQTSRRSEDVAAAEHLSSLVRH